MDDLWAVNGPNRASPLSMPCLLLTAIISHSDRQLLGNKLSFTLCSIHILFISNKFHNFWMSFDFRRTHAKKGAKVGKIPGRLAYPRPAGLAPPHTVPHLQSRGNVMYSSASELWIGCRFNRMDRKACTRIKGPTIQ